MLCDATFWLLFCSPELLIWFWIPDILIHRSFLPCGQILRYANPPPVKYSDFKSFLGKKTLLVIFKQKRLIEIRSLISQNDPLSCITHPRTSRGLCPDGEETNAAPRYVMCRSQYSRKIQCDISKEGKDNAKPKAERTSQ